MQPAPAEHVEMEMEYRLPRLGAIIRQHPVATVGDALLLGNRDRQPQQIGDHRLVACPEIAQRREMTARHDQDVCRSLRLEIAKGDAMFALGDELGAQLAPDDLAENAIGIVAQCEPPAA